MTPLDEAAWFDERVAMILQDIAEPTSQEITKANLEAMKQLRAFKASGHAWVTATQEHTGDPFPPQFLRVEEAVAELGQRPKVRPIPPPVKVEEDIPWSPK